MGRTSLAGNVAAGDSAEPFRRLRIQIVGLAESHHSIRLPVYWVTETMGIIWITGTADHIRKS